MGLDECCLLDVASMAWAPGPESAGKFMVERSKIGMGSPNNFKFRRAAHQRVLSGGTNRPVVEEAALLSTELGYNPLEISGTDFDRKRA